MMFNPGFMYHNCKLILLFLILMLSFWVHAGNTMLSDSVVQKAVPDSLPKLNKNRLALVLGGEAVVAVGSLTALDQLWFQAYPRSELHSFDDSHEWLQMDKMGHATTAYYIGRVGIGLLKWTGMERRKAIWYGGLLGPLYQTTIEVMDGCSSGWGFSWSDIGANTAGTILCMGQQLGWDEQRIILKYSFHTTSYPAYRPNILGENFQEQLLKDYNGQTYWLSVNVHDFLKEESKFPRWLNVAVGYGAEGMTGGSSNPPYFDASGKEVVFDRYRQFYLSLDADLTKIKTRSRFLKTLFTAVGFIKIPFPAVEFSKYGVKGSVWGF